MNLNNFDNQINKLSNKANTLFEIVSSDQFINKFTTNENLNYLTRIIMRRIEIDNPSLYPMIKKQVTEYINNWIGLSKFSEKELIPGVTILDQLNYYNTKFIEVFEYDIKKKFLTNYDTNPFFDKVNGKLRRDMRPEDYGQMFVQQEQGIYNNSLFRKTIPFYEKALYKRHHETNIDDNLSNVGNDRHCLIYSDSNKFDKQIAEIDDRSSNSYSSGEVLSLSINKYSKADLQLAKKKIIKK